MSKIKWTWNLGAARSTTKWREVQSKTSNLSLQKFDELQHQEKRSSIGL